MSYIAIIHTVHKYKCKQDALLDDSMKLTPAQLFKTAYIFKIKA